VKLIDIVGARPQFIKVAPVLKAIDKYNEEHADKPIDEVLIHTGQHYDFEMSQVFFNELGLKDPQYHLGVGSGSHGYQTGEMLKRIEDILTKESPDVVMVYGDTNSTLAGALAATRDGHRGRCYKAPTSPINSIGKTQAVVQHGVKKRLTNMRI
jgi:UDP-GlcNAc3NAcA epimerase